MKHKLLVILVMASGIIKSQYSGYCEVETKTEGIPLFAKMGNTKVKVYSKNDKSLIEMKTIISTVKTLYIGDDVTCTSGKDCYADKKSVISKLQAEDLAYEDVVVKKDPETKTILNYQCKKAVITYKTKTKELLTDQETIVWYTDKIKGFDGYNAMQGAENDNEYTKALRSLDGCILSTENISKESNVKGICTVTKLEIKDIPDDVFKLDTQKCDKIMTYKEFQTEMKRRAAMNSHRPGKY